MANKVEMNFKRGDGLIHYFQLPLSSWTPGGVLWFAAKAAIDNDNTDQAAVINKSFDDDKIVDSSHEMYDPAFVTYELEFVPGDITNVTFNNEKKKKYLGEFQYIPDTGLPETFPSEDDFIEVIIFADVKRGV